MSLLIDMVYQARFEDMCEAIKCIREFVREGACQDAHIVGKIISFRDIDALRKVP